MEQKSEIYIVGYGDIYSMKILNFLKVLIIYLLFLMIMIIVLSNKRNLNVDEILTYGLANNNGPAMEIHEGEKYTPSEIVFLNYVTVQPDAKFNFANVWSNQVRDDHPPFYYALVHTICSLFPGKFSIWYAGIINVVFSLLTLWIIRKISYELTGREDIKNFVSIFFITSVGVLQLVSFLRMYVMLMFFVSFITLVFMKAIKKDLSWDFYLKIILVTVAGAMTHYYFLIYLFFLCLVFGIWLLINKMFKQTAAFCASMGIAGGLSVCIYPYMIRQIFMGNASVGEESINNFLNSSLIDYLERMRSFYLFINDFLFGGFLTYVIIVIFLFYLIYFLFTKKSSVTDKYQIMKWVFLVVPGFCYFILVSKIAVYILDRYISSIYAITIVWIVCSICIIVGKLPIRKYQHDVVIGLLLFCMIVSGIKNCSWDNLSIDSDELFRNAARHAESDCIYIYDVEWKVCPSFYEVSKYRSVTFCKDIRLNLLADMDLNVDNGLVVCLINSENVDGILDTILELYPQLDSFEVIGSYVYSTSYYLYNSKDIFTLQGS